MVAEVHEGDEAMMSKACHARAIIKDMGLERCPIAVAFLQEMGPVIPVKVENIRKAVDLVRPQSALNFCFYWLDWPLELHESLHKLVARILYPATRRSRYYDLSHETRTRMARAAVTAAILTYRKEMSRP
jgi:hypothetical protein